MGRLRRECRRDHPAAGSSVLVAGHEVPAGGRPMTRLLREHPEIEVELDPAGRLVAITWGGRREPVESCTRWRVEDAWWGRPIARDYVKVVGTRWLALVYLDRVDGTWHLERLYD